MEALEAKLEEQKEYMQKQLSQHEENIRRNQEIMVKIKSLQTQVEDLTSSDRKSPACSPITPAQSSQPTPEVLTRLFSRMQEMFIAAAASTPQDMEKEFIALMTPMFGTPTSPSTSASGTPPLAVDSKMNDTQQDLQQPPSPLIIPPSPQQADGVDARPEHVVSETPSVNTGPVLANSNIGRSAPY